MCGEDFSIKNDNDRICFDCRSERSKFISKTDAKKEYLMLDDELEEFASFEVKLKYGRNQYGTYYITDEIIDFANLYHPQWIDKQSKAELRLKRKEELEDNRKSNINLLKTNHPMLFPFINKYYLKTYFDNGKINNFTSFNKFLNHCKNLQTKFDKISKYLVNEDILPYVNKIVKDYLLNDQINHKDTKLFLKEIKKRFDEVQHLFNIYSDITKEGFGASVISNYIKIGKVRDYINEKIIEYDIIETFIKGVHLRLNRILKRLNKYNIQLRTDSALCNAYIKYGIDAVNDLIDDKNQIYASSKDIADVMYEMHFLHNYTSYRECVRELIYERKRNDGFDRDLFIHPSEVSEQAKIKALRKYLKNHSKDDVPKSLLKKAGIK
jgi:hypothetical protein